GGGAVVIAFGSLSSWPRWAMFAGSAVFVGVCVRLLFMQPALPNIVMTLGALAWTGGNLLWALRQEIPVVVLWWVTFLLLIIVGERIELTRFQRPSRLGRAWLLVTLGFLALALAAAPWRARAGGLLVGVAMVAIAGWLLRFDLAWRTVRVPGLARFMAVCLL